MRSILTVLGFVCFLGICFWAYSKKAQTGFDEAARLPFGEDDAPTVDHGRQIKEG